MENNITREIIINEIKGILNESTNVCIHGVGGIGKTTILHKYKTILEEDKEKNKIIYIDFDDEELSYYQAFFSKISAVAAENGIELTKFNFALSICEESIPNFEITTYKTKESKENLQDIYGFISACFQEFEIASKTIKLSKFIYRKYEEFKVKQKISKVTETDEIFKNLFILIEDKIFDKNIQKISTILVNLLVIDLQDIEGDTKNYILIDTFEKFLSSSVKTMENPPQLELLKISTSPILIASRQALPITNLRNYSITGLAKMEVEKLLDNLDILKEKDRAYIHRCSYSNPYIIKVLAMNVKKNPYDRICLDIDHDILQKLFFENFSIQEQETIKLLAYLDYFDEEIFKILITKYQTGYPITAFKKFVCQENYHVMKKFEVYAIHDNSSEHIQNNEDSKLLQSELDELMLEYYNYKKEYIKSFEITSKPYKYIDKDNLETSSLKQEKIYELIYNEHYILKIPFHSISKTLFEYYQQRFLNIVFIKKLIVNLPILYFDRKVNYEDNELIKELLNTNLDSILIALLYIYLAGEVDIIEKTKASSYLKFAEQILIKEEIQNNKKNMHIISIIKSRLLLEIIRFDLRKEFKRNTFEDFFINFRKEDYYKSDKIFFSQSLVICELHKNFTTAEDFENIVKKYLLNLFKQKININSVYYLYGILLILEKIFISIPREIELIIFNSIRKNKKKTLEKHQVFLYLFFLMYSFKKKDHSFNSLDYEKIAEAVRRYQQLMNKVVLLEEFSEENLEKLLSNISVDLGLDTLNLNIENEIILFLKEDQKDCTENYNMNNLYDFETEAYIPDELLETTHNYSPPFRTHYQEFIDKETDYWDTDDFHDDDYYDETPSNPQERYEYELYKLNSVIRPKKEYELKNSSIEKKFHTYQELERERIIEQHEDYASLEEHDNTRNKASPDDLNFFLETSDDSQDSPDEYKIIMELLESPVNTKAQIYEDKLVKKTKIHNSFLQTLKKFFYWRP